MPSLAKMARTVWALLRHGQIYNPPPQPTI